MSAVGSDTLLQVMRISLSFSLSLGGSEADSAIAFRPRHATAAARLSVLFAPFVCFKYLPFPSAACFSLVFPVLFVVSAVFTELSVCSSAAGRSVVRA